MADWQEQLNTILSDPDAMARIASLAQSISGKDGGKPSAPPPEPRTDPPTADAPPIQLDPELLRRLVPLARQFNRPESSDAAAFLHALRPFLSEKRRDKVERAAQLARLIHLGKTFLTTRGEEAGA